MTNTKHTKGEYIACTMTMSRSDWISMYDGITAIVRSGEDVLATVWHPDETEEAEMAQAQLFAAAPLLYNYVASKANSGDNEAAILLKKINGE